MHRKKGSLFRLRWLLAVLLLVVVAVCAGSAPKDTPANASPAGSAKAERPFDCSRINELGIDKQTNFHAMQLLAACQGRSLVPQEITRVPHQGAASGVIARGPSGATGVENAAGQLNPLVYGGVDQDIILPDAPPGSTYNTQSESFVWGNGNTIVSAYNDIRGSSTACAGAVSYSIDGGVTWVRPGGSGVSPLCSGHASNFGDPTVIWNQQNNLWYTSFLASGCGGQGIGLWTSGDGVTWSVGACAHIGGADDRQSHWVDNNSSSPFYGRQYISWNNFAAGQNIFVVYSDNGTTWSAPVQVQTGGFIRNVQLTGSSGNDGTVFIAAMDEGGGGLNQRTNILYRSTNGGANWTSSTIGSPFPAPGDGTCPVQSYFAIVAPYIRFEGWGQPAVGPANVVHYVYAGQGSTTADKGDIYYTRSTDNGDTWLIPAVRLNTDTGTRTQWMPSLSATGQGAVFASWYDRRNTTNNDYEYYGRKSLNGGLAWQTDVVISDQIIPMPPAPSFNACYMGDFMYASANNNNAYVTWADGRIAANGQDTFFDKENLLVATPRGTPTPPCSPVPCTATPINSSTRTHTLVPTLTPTATYTYSPTDTRSPTSTVTPTPTHTATHTTTPVPTPTVTLTPVSTASPTMAPTPCTINFGDVYPEDYFFVSVRYLACHGVVSGYQDGTFRPYNNTTRGQLTKIVVLAEGWTLECSTQHFSDVFPSDPFYCFIETAFGRGIISGYADGTFRPGNNVTRGQVCKIIVSAQGWNLDCPLPGHFSDVQPPDPFFCFVETAYTHSIISGYADGTFRPGNGATRGQICKIVYQAVTTP
jgi:hypothetical protein